MTKFPNGMAYVADSLHNMSLGFGMYSSAGKLTCAQYAGSLGMEKQDAMTFAGWGVDYLKYDNCYNEGQESNSMISYNRYKAMSDALNATGRPIFYSICNWGTDYPWNWAPTIANSWRISGDIYDSFDRPDTRCPCTTWDCKLPGFHCSVMNILNKVPAFTDKGRVGGWNDLDALEVGNSGMTDDEYKLHMTMWYVAAGLHATPLSSIFYTNHSLFESCRALFKSPLILGTDITLLSPSTLSIIANPAILAISQDPAGKAAFRVWEKSPALVENNTYSTDLYTAGSTYFFTGQLTGGTSPSLPISPLSPFPSCQPPFRPLKPPNSPPTGDFVIAFLNAGPTTQPMSATMNDIFVDQVTTGSSAPVPHLSVSWDVHDLWANRMPDNIASAILNGTFNNTSGANTDMLNGTAVPVSYFYNSTHSSYEEGLGANNTALLGKKVGVLNPGGEVSASVAGHGVEAYRLRSQTMIPSASKMRRRKRDEL